VEIWLDGREAGPVFTAMIDDRGDMLDQRTTRKRMTTRSVQRMLKRCSASVVKFMNRVESFQPCVMG